MAIAPIRFCLRCKKPKKTEEFPLNIRGLPSSACIPCTDDIEAEKNLPAYTKRVQYLAHRHKVSVNEIITLLESNDGTCDICKVDLTKVPQTHVDHDHETGKLRGILCVSCNSGIGNFHDSKTKLIAAAEYLERYATVDRFERSPNVH